MEEMLMYGTTHQRTIPPPSPIVAIMEDNTDYAQDAETCLALGGGQLDMIFATTIGTPPTLAVVDTRASGGFAKATWSQKIYQ